MIDQICGNRIILKRKHLQAELQAINNTQPESVATAIDRFEMMGLVEIT
jgi:hypothetical protein